MSPNYKQIYFEKDPRRTLLNSARSNAKKKGIEFNIILEDIVLPELCPFFNFPLTCIRGEGRIPSNYSIDRIDSSKGYIKGNIQIISNLANVMKNNATIFQLKIFARSILRRYR